MVTGIEQTVAISTLYFIQTGSSVGVYLKLDRMGYLSTVQPGLDYKLVQTCFILKLIPSQSFNSIIIIMSYTATAKSFAW